MNFSKKIHLFWWSAIKLEGKSQENFGDILSKYLVEKISGRSVVWKNPSKTQRNPFKKKIITTTGSILKHISKDCIVWGSGIISKKDAVAKAKFLAVRGPETQKHLTSMGYKVPSVFGDPAIVLPTLYNPKLAKQFKIGIIPHYVDYNKVTKWYSNNPEVKVINLLNDDVEAVIDEITSCKQVISSSLHGVIVSHTYNIPAVWVQFSKKLSGDNIKFVDYFKSVNLHPYSPDFMDELKTSKDLVSIINSKPNLPENGLIEDLSAKLMGVCPFKN